MAGIMGGTLQADLLGLILNGTPIANIALNATSDPLTHLYASLLTADPGAGGDQATNEISYTGYGRVGVARNPSSPAWTVTGSNPASASPNASFVFGLMTGGDGGTATHVGIGTLGTGAGELLWAGALSPTVLVANGVTPEITIDSTVTVAVYVPPA